MSNSQRKGKLGTIRNILKYRIKKVDDKSSEENLDVDDNSPEKKSDIEIVKNDVSNDKDEKTWICPCCSEVMLKVREFMPVRAAPVV